VWHTYEGNRPNRSKHKEQEMQTAPTIYKNAVFAPLDRDHCLERIAGGNETEVYRSDDHRYVVKLKAERLGNTRNEVLQWARLMRDSAEEFTDCLGPSYSVPNHFVLSCDDAGDVQILVVQPYISDAHPLHDTDYARLSPAERQYVARQLRDIIRRALTMYRATGRMPDLYGRASASKHERKRSNTLVRLPVRLWSFLVQRNLLLAHNLLLTAPPERRVVLIDYDIVRQGKFYQRIYYLTRWFLFWRDHLLIRVMQRSGFVPRL
jgi:hypothetical protein